MQVLDASDTGFESRFNLLARAMRTLVDLLHTEHGYARIFHDQEGYSYELHSYEHTLMTDLFTRMPGFSSATDATEAARETLTAIHTGRRSKGIRSGRARKPRRTPPPQVTQLILPVGVH
jgi:hypothetical protein